MVTLVPVMLHFEEVMLFVLTLLLLLMVGTGIGESESEESSGTKGRRGEATAMAANGATVVPCEWPAMITCFTPGSVAAYLCRRVSFKVTRSRRM
jgi:hypothetical protein